MTDSHPSRGLADASGSARRSAPTDPPGPSIDPIAALRHLQESGDLDGPQATMLRVLWVRSEHPDTRVETELTHLRDDLVVFRALVAMPGGAVATGYASETGAPGKSLAIAIERAETRAIGRALDILGYVITAGGSTQHADDTGTPPVIDALRRASLRRQPTGTIVVPEPEVDSDTGEITDVAEQDVRDVDAGAMSQVSADRQPATTADSGEDPPLEDYTWTHFWKWARAHDLATKGQVEQRIGRSFGSLTPAEVRIALQETGIEL